MEKGQKVQVKIDDITTEGQGVGRTEEGIAVFVKGALPGDLVEAELTKCKKRYAFGELLEIVEPSEWRIEAVCKYFGQCGGCPLGLLSYEGQLALKEKQVADRLSHLGGIGSPKVNSIIGMDSPFFYRNKATMPVSTGGIVTRKGGVVENLGDPAIGFYRGKSHEVIDCEECMIQSRPAMAIAAAVRRFMKEDNITGFDPKWGKGLMRNLIVRTAFGTGEVMAILVINGKGIPNAAKLIEMMDEAIAGISTDPDGIEYSLESVITVTDKSGSFGDSNIECTTLAGKPTITEVIGDMKFEISPLSFYQVNPVQMKKLYDKAAEYADLHGGETVLDLYCGVGTIGLYLIKNVPDAKVIGIESVKSSVRDANRNAVINHIVNARYVCGRAENELPKLISGEGLEDRSLLIGHADVAIMDPPRSGCDERLLDAVAEAAPSKVVYVSCDPATLARDIKYLGTKGYEFIEATPVDQFSWTGHVETVVLMSRVEDK